MAAHKVAYGWQYFQDLDGKWKGVRVRQYETLDELLAANEGPLSEGAKRYVARLKRKAA